MFTELYLKSSRSKVSRFWKETGSVSRSSRHPLGLTVRGTGEGKMRDVVFRTFRLWFITYESGEKKMIAIVVHLQLKYLKNRIKQTFPLLYNILYDVFDLRLYRVITRYYCFRHYPALLFGVVCSGWNAEGIMWITCNYDSIIVVWNP